MRMVLVVAAVFAALVGSAPAVSAAETFRIVNNARTEINARVRLYSDEFIRISVGEEAEMSLPKGRASAAVEIRTRKRWENCYVYAFPGATVVARQDHAKIVCRVKR